MLHMLGGSQVNMLVLAGVLLLLGALAVTLIKETYAEATAAVEHDYEPEI